MDWTSDTIQVCIISSYMLLQPTQTLFATRTQISFQAAGIKVVDRMSLCTLESLLHTYNIKSYPSRLS